MQRYQSILPTEEQYLVYDIDDALRVVLREYMFPWTLKKSTLRVFQEVLEYPIASDHRVLAFIDSQEGNYEEKARPYYTSIKEFYEDPNAKSSIAEIWDEGARFLGIRNKAIRGGMSVIDTAELDSGYTISGDIDSKTIDTVVYKKGNASLRLEITNAAGTAKLVHAPTSYSNTNYKRSYYFRYVYLDAAPTSVTLEFGNDATNLISSGAMTAQFSGQPFKADAWNLVGFDLNTGTVSGTIDNTAFDYETITLTGAATGTYYVDESSVREWKDMDYWYYSNLNVMLEGSSVADQKFFQDADLAYNLADSLVADDLFVDVIMYDALLPAAADRENEKLFGVFTQKRERAWDTLMSRYPDMEPLITTHRWNFASQQANLVIANE